MATDRETPSAASPSPPVIRAQAVENGWSCGFYLCPHQPKCEFAYVDQYEVTLDSLEHILFGDVQKRSRDELEQRAAEAICAWNERPA